MIRKPAILIAALALANPWRSAADVVVMADRQVEGTVRQITAEQVVLEGEAYPLAAVRSLAFSRSAVVAPLSGLVMTDGSHFGGRLRELSAERVRFRTVSLGEVVLPLNRVAYLYFGDEPSAPLAAPAGGGVRVTLRTGVSVSGTLFGASPNRVLLRVGAGLEKYEMNDVGCLVFGAVQPTAGAVVLRNGDRLYSPVTWTGGGFDVEIGGQKFSLGLDAVKELTFVGKREQKG